MPSNVSEAILIYPEDTRLKHEQRVAARRGVTCERRGEARVRGGGGGDCRVGRRWI
ncbi:hypothetical protein J6590_063801 [Homalodisca vitripennis]|nr:hypothetical protein J6590_063801 [Homalodisca vitripennis]